MFYEPFTIRLIIFVLLSPLFIFILKDILSFDRYNSVSELSFFLEYRGGNTFLLLLSLGSLICLFLVFLALLGLIFFVPGISEIYFLEHSLLLKYRLIFRKKYINTLEFKYSDIEDSSSWLGKKIILDIRKFGGRIDKQIFRVLNESEFSLQYLFNTRVLAGRLQFEPGQLGVKIGRRGTEMPWHLALVICFISFLFYVCFQNLSYEVSVIQLILVFLVVWFPICIIVFIFLSIKEVVTNRKSSLYYSPIDSAIVLSDFVNGQDYYTQIYLSHIISFNFNMGKKLELVYVQWDENLKETKKTINFLFSQKLSKETIQFLELMISEEEGGLGKIGSKAWDAYSDQKSKSKVL
jgi:hypothetical protein